MNKSKRKNRHLIIGAGEVGGALHSVLKKYHNVSIRDKDNDVKGRFDVLHVAYPPFPKFVRVTKSYIKLYKPSLVIIHSTVPVGTTAKLGKNAVHSPIRGVHPNLDKGVRTFVKYFGGPKAKIAEKLFKKMGIPTLAFSRPETTELLKILDTTYYGWNIVFAKEVKRICDKLGLDFKEVYTIPNWDYNKGYVKLGKKNVVRPVLLPMPGKIGGHCVIQNCGLLDDWLTRELKNRNKTY